MSSDRSDQELLRAFAVNGEEEAFRGMMARYTDLVFGTALRVVRERTVAEEVTQNVFVALARKAAFLPVDTCLGAWLHKGAVLEAKNCMVHTPDEKLVVLQGLEEFIVVDTNDVLMICKKDKEQEIKDFVTEIKRNKGDKYL